MLREIDKDGNWATTTTDKIIFEDKNHFKDWYCSAGKKGLYIDHDGNIWRGLCFSADVDRFNFRGWYSHIKTETNQYLQGSLFGSEEFQYWYKNNKDIISKLGNNYRKLNEAYELTVYAPFKNRFPGIVGNIFEGFFTDVKQVKAAVKCPFDTCGCGSDIWYPKSKTKKSVDNIINFKEYTEEERLDVYKKIEVNKKETIEKDDITALEPNYNIDYQVLWDIGRRCNYDCEYCWPSVHNTDGPHIDYKTLRRTLGAIIYWIVNKPGTIKENLKTTKFFFSGGEPTLNPDFLKICHWLQSEKQLVSVSTNGTNTEEYYTNLAQVVNNFLFSIHFGSMEKFKIINEKKLLKNIKKVLTVHRLHSLRDKWVELKIMAPPGYVNHALKFYDMAISETPILDTGRDKRPLGALTIVPIRTIGKSNTTAIYSDEEKKLLEKFYADTV